jgi:hypothetical protein
MSAHHRRLGCLASSIAVWLCRAEAFAAEVCHFTGTTDYAGHVTVTTDAAATAGVTRIDVAAAFESTTMFWLGVRYLIEEVSTWRAGHLESVAVNSRYLLGNYIVRQQWDKFERSADGFQAHRVQAKTLADFRLRHPNFVQHWDPATFRQPWLDDYQSASPERRADLDLRGSPLPSGLRSPLAMAFYWIRWLPRGDQSRRAGISARFQGRAARGSADHSCPVGVRHSLASALAILSAEQQPGLYCHGLDLSRWISVADGLRAAHMAGIGTGADQSGRLRGCPRCASRPIVSLLECLRLRWTRWTFSAITAPNKPPRRASYAERRPSSLRQTRRRSPRSMNHLSHPPLRLLASPAADTYGLSGYRICSKRSRHSVATSAKRRRATGSR